MVLLDTSGSMKDRIGPLEEGLQTLLSAIRQDEIACKRVDLAVMTFDSSVSVIHDFGPVDQWSEFLHLQANGQTNMGAALVEAARRIERRRQEYKTNGIPYNCAWLFLLTDGEPTDSMAAASEILRGAEKHKRLNLFPVGVGADVDLEKLKRTTYPRACLLNEARWQEMFVWFSRQLKSASRSKPGGEMSVESPSQWAIHT
jgi:uncharacterized protein YegL